MKETLTDEELINPRPEIKDMIDQLDSWTYVVNKPKQYGKSYIQSLLEEKDAEIKILQDKIKKIKEYIEKYETIRGYYEYEECGYDGYNYDEDIKKEMLEIIRGDENE